MEIDLKSIYIPSDKIVTRKIEDELIIVPVQSGLADLDDTMFSLNETGQAAWEKLNPDNNVEKICLELADEFDASFEEIKDDILTLFEQLFLRKLIIKVKKY